MQRENKCFILGHRHKLSRHTASTDNRNQDSGIHKGFISDKSQLETILGPSRPDWFERLTEQRLDCKLSAKPTKSTLFDSPSTPTISQLISVNSLKVGNSPKFNYDSPVQFRSSCGESPVLTPNCWNDWQKPLLGHSPSPRHRALNTTSGHLSSTGVRSLGVNADDSALAWTNSLATPPRDLSELSTDQDTPPPTGHKDLARALFSPGGDRYNVTEDFVQALDSTYEEDIPQPAQPCDLQQQSGDQHKQVQQLSKSQPRTVEHNPHSPSSFVPAIDNSSCDLISEACSPLLAKSSTLQTDQSSLNHEHINRSKSAGLQEQDSSEFQSENNVMSLKTTKNKTPQFSNVLSEKKNKDKNVSVKKHEKDVSSKTVLDFRKVCHESKLQETIGSDTGIVSKHVEKEDLVSELYPCSCSNEEMDIDFITAKDKSKISKPANRGKRIFDEVDQAEIKAERNDSVTSPTFSQKSSRKFSSTKKKLIVDKRINRCQNSYVDEALSDFFDSPASVARKRRRTSLPASYTFTNSPDSLIISSDSESQVRCSTPKERAPSLQSILSSSRKKKTCGSTSEKKVRFSDSVKKYSIHSEFSPILKKKKKYRHSNKQHVKDQNSAESNKDINTHYDLTENSKDASVGEKAVSNRAKGTNETGESDKALSAYENHRHLKPNCSQLNNDDVDFKETNLPSYECVGNTELENKHSVNSVGDHKVTELKQRMDIDETGDFCKKQIKCKIKLKTKSRKRYNVNGTESLSKDPKRIEEQETNEKVEKLNERQCDVGTDEFSQISPSALNEMCSVADQSETLEQAEENRVNSDINKKKIDKERTKNSDNVSDQLKTPSDSKEINANTERGRKKKTPMKFIYPTKSHILNAIPQKVFQFEENSQTEKRKSLVKPVLVANIVPKNDELSSPKLDSAHVSEMDIGSKSSPRTPSSRSDMDVNTKETKTYIIRKIQENKSIEKESSKANEPTKDTYLSKSDSLGMPNLLRLNDTDGCKSGKETLQDIDKSSSNKEKATPLAEQAAQSIQGFQSASGKSIKFSTESINKASKLLLDETVEQSNIFPVQYGNEITDKSPMRNINSDSNDRFNVVNDIDGVFEKEMEFSEEWAEDVDLDPKEADAIDSSDSDTNDKDTEEQYDTKHGNIGQNEVEQFAMSKYDEIRKDSSRSDAKLTNIHPELDKKFINFSMMPGEVDQGFSGFKTAPGTKITCSEEQFKKAESYMNEEKEGTVSSKISDEKLKNTKNTDSSPEFQIPHTNDNVASSKKHSYNDKFGKRSLCASSSLGGFSTASGKAFKFSDEHIEKANSIFNDISEESDKEKKMVVSNMNNKLTPIAQQNNNIDMNTLRREQCSINVGEGDSHTVIDNQPGTSSSKQDFIRTSECGGFSTAGGKTLKLSNVNLNKASSIFGDIAEGLQDDSHNPHKLTLNSVVDGTKVKHISKVKTTNLIESLKSEFENDLSAEPESLDLLTEELRTLKSKKITEASIKMPSNSREPIAINKPALEAEKTKNVPKGFRPFKAPRPSGGVKVNDKPKAKYPESKIKEWGKPLDDSATQKVNIQTDKQTSQNIKSNSSIVPKVFLTENESNNIDLQESKVQIKTRRETDIKEIGDHLKVRNNQVHSNDINEHTSLKSDQVYTDLRTSVKPHNTKVDTEINYDILKDEKKKSEDVSDELETSNELYQGLSQMFAEDLEPSFEAIEKSSLEENYRENSPDQTLQKQIQGFSIDMGNTISGFTLASGKAFSVSEKSLLSAQNLFDDDNLQNVLEEKLSEQKIKQDDTGKTWNKDRQTPEPNAVTPKYECIRSLNTSIVSLESDSVGRKDTEDEKDDSGMLVSESQETLSKSTSENMSLNNLRDGHVKDKTVDKGIAAVSEGRILGQLDTESLGSSKVCFGFQTASGKQVAVSEKAVTVAKNMLDESTKDLTLSENKHDENNQNTSLHEIQLRKEDQDISPCEFHEIKSNQFCGFKTAGGKGFNLSESAIEKGKQMLQDKSYENTFEETKVGENKVMDKELNRGEIRSKFPNSEVKENDGIDSLKCEDEKALTKEGFRSFQTASGKTVNVSEKTLICARKSLDIDTEKDSKDASLADSFKTASGKSVDISEKALSKARKSLDSSCDNSNIIDTADIFKSASGKAVEISQLAYLKAKKTLDDNDDSNAMKFSYSEAFQTASGKQVKESDNSLAQARQTLSDTDEVIATTDELKQNLSTYRAADEVHRPMRDITLWDKNPFQTASGHKVEISAEALAHTRKTFEDIDTNIDLSPGNSFKTASGSKVAVSEKAVAIARISLADVDQQLGNQNQQNHNGFAGIGFQTASGSKVAVSEKALARARKSLKDENNDKGNGFTGIGFQTASGSKVAVSEKALARARKSLKDENNDKGNGFTGIGFQTASGSKVAVSEKALAHARKSLEDENNDKGNGFTGIGFQTASGRKVAVSEKALAHARKSLEDENNDKGNGFAGIGFQTASGSKVAVSEKALAHARKSLEDENDDKGSGFAGIGFQTASGSKVSVTEKALAHARKSLIDVGDENDIIVKSSLYTPSGSKVEVSEKGFSAANTFQTALGSKITVSEKALTQARKSLEDDENNKEFSAANIFQTASGSRVNISKKALAKAKNSLEEIESDKVFCVGNAFHTASGGNVEVSEKALSLARKSLDIESNTGFNVTNSFQTASGNKVTVSEKALVFGRKSLEEVEGDKGLNPANPFQTASGSKVVIFDKALVFARRSLHVDEQENKSGSLFTTASGNKVTVSNKALSAARRSLDDTGTTEDALSTAGLKFTESSTNKRDENSENIMEEELINLRFERDKLLKNKRSYESMREPEKTETQTEAGNGGLETCNSLPVKRQKLDDGLEKAFDDVFDRGPLKRKPLKSRPEGTTTDRRHPGFRPFKPVRCSVLQKPKISLDSVCKTDTGNNSHKDPQPAMSTFSTPYRVSAGTPQVTKETHHKVKVTAPIFRTNINHDEERCRNDQTKLLEHKPNVALISDVNLDKIHAKSLKVMEDINMVQPRDIDNNENVQKSEITKGMGNKDSEEDYNKSVGNQGSSSDLGLQITTSLKEAKQPIPPVCDELDSDMDSYSQDEQDVFYCTLVEARRQQEEIIRSKVKVRPMVGRLFEMKEMTGRWKLRDLLVKTNTSHCAMQPVPAVCAASAVSYKFCLDDHYSKHTAHVLLGDGAFLVPDDGGYAGKQEFYSAFLTLAGVDGKLINEAWLYNHYRWIVWKLAAYEVCMPSLSGRCLTPEMVMLQLKYRYDREIDLAQRSAIRKIFERDDTPCKRMVLCVAGIKYRGSITGEPTNTKILDGQATLELTDGWYSIWAQLDVPLSDLVRQGRICVGQKICTTGAELIGGDGACSPLEAPESMMLKICSNSARPCPWDCPLGYQKDPRPLCVPLSGLYGEGGAVGMVDVVIVRKYPILYMEKLAGGGNVFRTGRCEEKARQEYESRRQIDMQKVIRDIEAQADKENKQEKPKSTSRRKWRRTEVESLCTGQEIYEGLNCAQQPDSFQSYLSDRQMELLYDYQRQVQEEKQAEMNSRFQSAWQDKQETTPDRNVTPVLKFRVCGCSRRDMDSKTNTILTVWRPASEISELQEGKRYKIYSLTTSTSRSKYTGHSVQVTATKQTKFQLLPLDENFLDNIYEPREVLWVSDIKRRRPAYGELDFVGLIVRVVPATAMESGKPCDTVYMSDCQGALLAMKIWNGFKSFGEDLFLEGCILCCSNLMDKSTFRSHHLPIVEAASEFTMLNKTPQNSGHRKAFERLNAVIKEKPSFLEYAQNILDNFLSGASPYPESNMKTAPVKRDYVVTPRSSRDPAVGSNPSNSEVLPKTPSSTQLKDFQKETESEDMEVSTNTNLSTPQVMSTPQAITTPQTTSTPQNMSTPQSDQSKKQKSIYQSKMARLLSYDSPSCLSPLNTPVTRGVRKGFKPPAFKK